MAECDAVCEHIHLPLQSGSSRLLKAMRRTYDRERYLKLVAKLRDAIPGLALGTDIIVGFPGETEDDFQETLEVVEHVRYDSAFTFIYSPRHGTEAAELPDQIADEVKHERLERLVDVVQRIAAERNAERVGTVEEVLVEGSSRTDATLLRGPHARQRHRQLHRRRRSGRARRRRDRRRHLDDAPRRPAHGGGRLVHVLITGSSGQIGTNLALRLQADGHEVFGVDKRVNTWTDDFRYLLQDLSGHYPAFPGGIGGVQYPETDLVVHLAAHAKVHQLVAQPHRALENTMMTFNVLEYCRQRKLPLVFSSTREVYGDVHRFEGYGEATADFAFTESPYSASKIASEAFIYSYARCYGLQYLVFRFSNVYGRYDNDLHRMARVLPLFIHSMSRGRADHGLRRRATRCSTSRTSTTASTGSSRGIEALASGRVANETINLAYGEGNTLVRAAELIAAELGVEPQMTIAPSLLGEVTRYVADIRKARELLGWEPQVPLDEGIPRAVAWFQEHRAAHPEEDRPGRERGRLALAGRRSPQIRVLAQRPRASSARPPRARPPSPRRSRTGSPPSSSRPTRCRSTAACRCSRTRTRARASSGSGRSTGRAPSASTSASRTRRSTRSSPPGGRPSSSAARASGSRRR